MNRENILEDLPYPTLYKYRSCNEFGKRILTGELYFSSPREFNDPFDSALPFRYNREEMTRANLFRKLVQVAEKNYPELPFSYILGMARDRLESSVFDDDDYWASTHSQQIDMIYSTYGMFCLSTKKDHPLMWAHYADSHKGICIGFNSEMLTKEFEKAITNFAICEVGYADAPPFMPLLDTSVEDHFRLLSTKGKDWEYEGEYRFIKDGFASKSLCIPTDTITEIILGCKMQENKRLEVIDSAKKLRKAKIFKAQLSLETFRLEIIPLDF